MPKGPRPVMPRRQHAGPRVGIVVAAVRRGSLACPDLLRPEFKYATNPRAWGGLPPDGFSLSRSEQKSQLQRSQQSQEYRSLLRVASKSSGVSGLADRYATALFDLADERKSLDQVAGDLRQLRAMLADSAELRRLVRSPSLTRIEQGRAITAVAERAGLASR